MVSFIRRSLDLRGCTRLTEAGHPLIALIALIATDCLPHQVHPTHRGRPLELAARRHAAAAAEPHAPEHAGCAQRPGGGAYSRYQARADDRQVNIRISASPAPKRRLATRGIPIPAGLIQSTGSRAQEVALWSAVLGRKLVKGIDILIMPRTLFLYGVPVRSAL